MSENASSPSGSAPVTSRRGVSDRPPETRIPADQRPAGRCPYCQRPFPTERLHALHIGDVHPHQCTDEERESYEQACDDETDELFLYHFKIVGALGITYALFVVAYMVALS